MVAPAGTEDEVAGSLRDLAARYAQQIGSCARIEQVFGQGEGVVFRPLRPGAAPVGWVDSGDALTVIAGEYGRVRFPRRPGGVETVRMICDAVITGRVRRVSGPARTHVTVELPDGRLARLGAGKDGLKSVLSRRRARGVAYLPYC
jgi:hypothetical protein